ncbi:unnamed protein product, partial [Coregonus sp. 'balchen']
WLMSRILPHPGVLPQRGEEREVWLMRGRESGTGRGSVVVEREVWLWERRALDFTNRRALDFTNRRALDFTNRRALDFTNKRALDFTNKRALDFTNRRALDFTNKRALDFTNKRALDFTNKRALDFTNRRALDFTNRRALDFTNRRALDFTNRRALDFINRRALDFTNRRALDFSNRRASDQGEEIWTQGLRRLEESFGQKTKMTICDKVVMKTSTTGACFLDMSDNDYENLEEDDSYICALSDRLPPPPPAAPAEGEEATEEIPRLLNFTKPLGNSDYTVTPPAGRTPRPPQRSCPQAPSRNMTFLPKYLPPPPPTGPSVPLIDQSKKSGQPPPPKKQPPHHHTNTKTTPTSGHSEATSTKGPKGMVPVWYGGLVTRGQAEASLRWVNKDGAFLVRDSSKGSPEQPYTLMVLNQGKIRHQGNTYHLDTRLMGRETWREELEHRASAACCTLHHSDHNQQHRRHSPEVMFGQVTHPLFHSVQRGHLVTRSGEPQMTALQRRNSSSSCCRESPRSGLVRCTTMS